MNDFAGERNAKKEGRASCFRLLLLSRSSLFSTVALTPGSNTTKRNRLYVIWASCCLSVIREESFRFVTKIRIGK